MTTKNKILVFGGAATAVAAFFFGRAIYRKVRLEQFLNEMGDAATGDINVDLRFVFSGQPYINSLQGKRLILLQDTVARQYANDLKSYICQTWICRTKVNNIFLTFEKAANKAQVAQISQWYKSLFGRELLTDLNADLNTADLDRVRGIIFSKPDYEIAA